MSTDFYELTMASACFSSNQNDKVAIFELFVPSRTSFYLLEFLQSRIKRNHMKSNKKIVKNVIIVDNEELQ